MDGKKSRREALPGTGSVLRRTSYFLAGHCHHFDDEEDEDDDDDDNGEDLLTTRSFLCRTSYVPFAGAMLIIIIIFVIIILITIK